MLQEADDAKRAACNLLLRLAGECYGPGGQAVRLSNRGSTEVDLTCTSSVMMERLQLSSDPVLYSIVTMLRRSPKADHGLLAMQVCADLLLWASDAGFPTDAIQVAWQQARNDAIFWLRDRATNTHSNGAVLRSVSLSDAQAMKALVLGNVGAKSTAGWSLVDPRREQSAFARTVLEAFLASINESAEGGLRPNVHVAIHPGYGTAAESRSLPRTVVMHLPVARRFPPILSNAIVALFNVSIGLDHADELPDEDTAGAEDQVDPDSAGSESAPHPPGADQELRESNFILEPAPGGAAESSEDKARRRQVQHEAFARRLAGANVRVLASQKRISPQLTMVMQAHGIHCLPRLSKRYIDLVAQVTGATVLSSIAAGAVTYGALGYIESVTVQVIDAASTDLTSPSLSSSAAAADAEATLVSLTGGTEEQLNFQKERANEILGERTGSKLEEEDEPPDTVLLDPAPGGSAARRELATLLVRAPTATAQRELCRLAEQAIDDLAEVLNEPVALVGGGIWQLQLATHLDKCAVAMASTSSSAKASSCSGGSRTNSVRGIAVTQAYRHVAECLRRAVCRLWTNMDVVHPSSTPAARASGGGSASYQASLSRPEVQVLVQAETGSRGWCMDHGWFDCDSTPMVLDHIGAITQSLCSAIDTAICMVDVHAVVVDG